MKLLYNVFLFYPYYFLRTIVLIIVKIIKTIFFNQIRIDDIDKMTGYEFEYFIKTLFIKSGYKNVSMSSSSGDFGIDIFASKDNYLYGIQCKRYKKRIGVEAIQQVKTGVSYYDLDIPVVITNSTFTPAANSLATNTDVVLIDRTALIRMIKKAKLFRSFIPWYYHLISLLLSAILIYQFLSYNQLFILMILSICLNIYMLIKSYLIYRSNKFQTSYNIHEYK